ncbi:MAG: helix-turn-helix domain-containing protein [Deltaproteobacteria bacterium]|nr:MAG: helix-turn-helix domain-containing protein [Deltaproteobacteria bacterium]
MSNENPKRGFSLTEAANYCGIPAKTIYSAKSRRAKSEERARFPVLGIKRGKQWLFLREDLDRWLNELAKKRQ